MTPDGYQLRLAKRGLHIAAAYHWESFISKSNPQSILMPVPDDGVAHMRVNVYLKKAITIIITICTFY